MLVSWSLRNGYHSHYSFVQCLGAKQSSQFLKAGFHSRLCGVPCRATFCCRLFSLVIMCRVMLRNHVARHNAPHSRKWTKQVRTCIISINRFSQTSLFFIRRKVTRCQKRERKPSVWNCLKSTIALAKPPHCRKESIHSFDSFENVTSALHFLQ